jgi:membrane dipeptidase
MATPVTDEQAQEVHRSAVVYDAVCPLLALENTLEDWIEGGATMVGPTVASDHDCVATMRNLAMWYDRLRRRRSQLLHVTSVADIRRAKAEHKLGILFHFQNAVPVGEDLGLVEIYYRLGVRMIQLTYNRRNLIGDGCEEPGDAGLSSFGVQLVKEMNRVGMVVDLSHTGYRTTMEAMQVSGAPVVFSHANVKALRDCNRNLRDDQIKAVAHTGGVIGLCGFPAFVSSAPRPTLDDLLAHCDYLANLVGVDHIGIGLDYFQGQAPYAPLAEAQRLYQASIGSGRWKPETYPPPPFEYPQGVETPAQLPNLTQALLARGYTPDEVRQILGENFLRVFAQVWK